MEQRKYTSNYENLFFGYILLMYLCGAQMDLLQLISIKLQMQLLLYAVVVIVTAVCVAVSEWTGEGKKYTYFIPLVCSMLVVIFEGDGIRRGALGLVDEMILRWNKAHEDGINRLLSGGAANIDMCAVILLCILVIMTILLRAGYRFVAPAASVIMLAFLLENLLTGDVLWYAIALMMAASVGLTFFYRERGQRIMAARACWITILALFMVGTGILFEGDLKTTKVLRDGAKQTVEDIRYGKNPLPEGNLYNAHKMCSGDQITLSVKSEEIKNLYLRGFEGGDYRDGIWKKMSNSAYGYEYSGMLQWLWKREFYPVTEYASYSKNSDDKLTKNHVTVKNIGADRQYIYTPYSLDRVRGGHVKAQKDLVYRSTSPIGAFKYSFTETSGNLPGELMVADSWIKQPYKKEQKKYMEEEEVYRKFVYDTYCKEDYSLDSLISAKFYDNAKSKDMTGMYAITCHIREVLRSLAVYREKPNAVPKGNDPIYWFLTDGREGNSALFASAGVLAFRKFGIPARYAEGYLVTKEQLEKNKGKTALTCKDSHAWVEVYLDGMGWVDVDVTPGFYYEEFELMQMVQKPQGIRMAADLQDDDRKDGNETGGSGKKSPAKHRDQDYVQVIAGGIISLLILFTCFIVYMEMRRYIRYRRWIRKIKNADKAQQSGLYCEIIFYEIDKMGIQAGIGWKVQEVEEKLRETVQTIYPGEFILVNGLLEKGVFSENALSDWELRALDEFTKKLLFDMKMEHNGLSRYIKIRYQ